MTDKTIDPVIDQMDRFGPAYARNFDDKKIAFVAVEHDFEGVRSSPALGIAVANEPGYAPVPKFIYAAPSLGEAQKRAQRLNREVLNLTNETEFGIVASTMGGRMFG